MSGDPEKGVPEVATSRRGRVASGGAPSASLPPYAPHCVTCYRTHRGLLTLIARTNYRLNSHVHTHARYVSCTIFSDKLSRYPTSTFATAYIHPSSIYRSTCLGHLVVTPSPGGVHHYCVRTPKKCCGDPNQSKWLGEPTDYRFQISRRSE